MSAPVDVLAVLNHHANGFSNGPVTLSETGAANLANELRQARVAVAELIEASEVFWRATDFGRTECSYAIAKRFETAVDRVKGAAA